MSGIDGVVLAPGSKRLLNDIELFGGIRVTTERFGAGAKVGSVRLPDFNKHTEMYTKAEPSMSDEEIKEAIEKIARKDAEKGQFHNMTKEYLYLKKEYISSVSPDRERIITNSTKQIFATANSLKSKPKEPASTLLEIIMDMEKKENDKIGVINMSSAEYKACLVGDNLRFVKFCTSNGETIGEYSSNGGWCCQLTEAESARRKEFSSTYNEAWRSADSEIKAQKNPSVPKHLEGGTAIDAYA